MLIAVDIDSTLHPYWDQFAAIAQERFGVELPYEHQHTWSIKRLRDEQIRWCVAQSHREEHVLARRSVSRRGGRESTNGSRWVSEPCTSPPTAVATRTMSPSAGSSRSAWTPARCTASTGQGPAVPWPSCGTADRRQPRQPRAGDRPGDRCCHDHASVERGVLRDRGRHERGRLARPRCGARAAACGCVTRHPARSSPRLQHCR